ncbi:hypothetical protein JYK21_13610 [Ralstonia pickettii]|nr:hypothetical protein [Ralstonia pickettii]
MRRLVAVALIFIADAAFATPQVAEVILVNDEPTALLAEPLAPLLEEEKISDNLRVALGGWCSTANWRGYVGTWEIRDGALYLVKLGSRCHQPSEVPLDAVIPVRPRLRGHTGFRASSRFLWSRGALVGTSVRNSC